MNQKQNLGIYLKPKEKVKQFFLNELKQINQKYTETKNFSQYKKNIKTLFQLESQIKKTKTTFYYLGGFIEGEGSLNLGVKKNKTSKFKLFFDPEFNITQHINGIQNLYLALCIFQTGRIRYKSSSDATFVYTIDNRKSLKEKVLPFYETYVKPCGCKVKVDRVRKFKQVLKLFDEKAHLNINRLIYELVPLWDSLRMQHNANQTFVNKQQAILFILKANAQSKNPQRLLRHPNLITEENSD